MLFIPRVCIYDMVTAMILLLVRSCLINITACYRSSYNPIPPVSASNTSRASPQARKVTGSPISGEESAYNTIQQNIAIAMVCNSQY